jgi:vanillate O-demethylase monooxygenase subunit
MGRTPFSAPVWRHWHPVLLTRDLGSRPKRVTLLGQDLVLFRAPRGGAVHALHDVCPHRRARLSDGWVEGSNTNPTLVCPYHGFRYGPDGRGHSPGTPQVQLACASFEVRERYGALWVRTPGSDTKLPELERDGYRQVVTLDHLVEAPLEVVVDNFCEVEHTPTTHALFGYRQESLPHIEVTTELTETTVRVTNVGPQKPIPRAIERLFGLYTDDLFIDDWTVHFSPVHIVYDQWWRDPKSGTPRRDRLQVGVFFTPVDDDQTRLFTFGFTSRPPSIIDPLIKPLLGAIVDREVRLDRDRIEGLADKRPDLKGTRLGRFDAALREHRKRIARLYRAETP